MLHTFGQEAFEELGVEVDARPIPNLCVNGSTIDAASTYSAKTVLVPYSQPFEALKAKAATLGNVVIDDNVTVIELDVLNDKMSVEETGTVCFYSKFRPICPVLS
jgi:hypothetical protein